MGKRVVSALIMLIIFVPLLIVGGNIFTMFMALLGIFSLYELLKLNDKTVSKKIFLMIYYQ